MNMQRKIPKAKDLATNGSSLSEPAPQELAEFDVWIRGKLRERLGGEEYEAVYQYFLDTSLLSDLATTKFSCDRALQNREREEFDLYELQAVICNKIIEGNEKESYTASMAKKGRLKVAEKFGEEAFELVTATIIKSKSFVVQEAADVFFHMIILLTSRDISIGDVLTELKRRTNMSGHEEKRSRNY